MNFFKNNIVKINQLNVRWLTAAISEFSLLIHDISESW